MFPRTYFERGAKNLKMVDNSLETF